MTSVRSFSEPIIFKPIFKEKLWGGQKLKTALLKEIPENSSIGESWELSGYAPDLSIATSKNFNNLTIQQLLKENPKKLLGDIHASEFFPLLFKFIDANERLSVQVHPNDMQAQQYGWGNFGKTECWYITEVRTDREIIVGFKDGVTLNDVESGIKDNTLDTLLNRITITKGDILFNPAGTVHAILEGTLLYEIQETSDTTFRLYDWGRVDKTGKSRQLHIAESLKVLDTSYHDCHKIPPVLVRNANGVHHFFRVACRYFTLEEYFFEKSTHITLPPKKSFSVLSVLDESFSLQINNNSIYTFSKGQTVLIPGECYRENITVEGESHCRFLLTSVPDLKTEVVDYLRKAGISDEVITLLGGNPASNDIMGLL